MKTTTLGALAIAVGLAGAPPSASLAQPAERPLERGYEQPAPGQGRFGMRRERLSPEQRVERRTERLRVLLQLRPEQERALSEYVRSLQRDPQARTERRAERRQMRELSTPERLEARRARLAERLERFETRAEATRRFYSQLTPSQREAFDAMPKRGGRMMRGPGRRGMGRG